MPRANSHINFVDIKEIADRAIRRTAVFVALGLNSAKRCSEYDLELEDIRHLSLLPDDPSEEVGSVCTEEFATWIITCGLRELLETFGSFLDEIDWACNGMRLRFSGETEKNRPISHEGFQYKGLAEKLALLDEMYSVVSERSEMLISINQVRHCLTHRRGIVGLEDCQKNSDLEVRWLGIEFFAETPSGLRIPTPIPLKDPYQLEEIGVLKWRFCERTVSFQVGNRVKLSARDIGEICRFVELASDQLLHTAIEYGKRIGVKFSEGVELDNKWAIHWQ
jgi:hypothetical protein